MQSAISRNLDINQVNRVENKIQALMGKFLGKELAQTIGVNSSQVTRWKGERGSDNHFVRKVAKFLVAIGYEEPENVVVIEGVEAANLARAFSMLIGKVGSENVEAISEPWRC